MRLTSSLAASLLGLVVASVATAALAFDFGVANAVSSGNLSVYLVRGADAAAASLTVEQALAGGQFKIHETDKLPIMVENLSGRSVFIQAGDMLKGGLQDQVAVYDYVIGPHSGRVPIETLCVDPFRAAARSGDSAKLFTAAGGLIPSRAATLALLAQSASDRTVKKLRQSAVWWSIASLRSGLSERLGHKLESPRRVSWDESQDQDVWARSFQLQQHSQWKTSLPMALEDPGLARIERPYQAALLAAGQRSGVIGAVFAINGRLEGAEIYQSGSLFRAMWPKLLRAYTIRALVAGPVDHAMPPSVNDVTAFLDAVDAGQSRAETPDGYGVRETVDAIATRSAGANGAWVHRGYVAKLAFAEASRSPEAAFVAALEAGEIQGVPLTRLDSHDPIVPQSNSSQDASSGSARDVVWRLEVPDFVSRATKLVADISRQRAVDDQAARARLIAAVLAVLLAVAVVMLLRRPVGRLLRVSGGAARALAVGARRQSMRLAGWARTAPARLRGADRAAETKVDAVPSTAPRYAFARLVDHRRFPRSRAVPLRAAAPRTVPGRGMASDLAA